MERDEIELILERVGDLYRKYGIKSVTMDDAARELGISKKTLYTFVKDKEDLVKQVMMQERYKMHHRFEGLMSERHNAIEELFEVNKQIKIMIREHSTTIDYDLKKYFPALFREIFEDTRQNMYEAVLKNIKRGKEEGLFRKDLNEEVIARLHVSRIMGMSENPHFSIEEITSDKVYNEIMVYHIRGMANENGIKYLEENLDKLEHID
jgi:AcrR family transcriptional regulator